MSVRYSPQNIRIPDGFQDILEALAREVGLVSSALVGFGGSPQKIIYLKYHSHTIKSFRLMPHQGIKTIIFRKKCPNLTLTYGRYDFVKLGSKMLYFSLLEHFFVFHFCFFGNTKDGGVGISDCIYPPRYFRCCGTSLRISYLSLKISSTRRSKQEMVSQR